MADLEIDFGSPSIFGTITGFVPNDAQGQSVSDSRAVAYGQYGDEAASKLYDTMFEYSQTFKNASATTPGTVPATIGALLGSGSNTVLLTSIEIRTQATDFPTIALAGHQHGTHPHANDRRQAAHGIALSVAFGAQNFLGDNSGLELQSSTCRIVVDHVDEPGQNGAHAAGQNYNGRIELTQEYLGGENGHGAFDSTGWDVISIVPGTTPQGFAKTTVTAIKPLTLSTPSPTT